MHGFRTIENGAFTLELSYTMPIEGQVEAKDSLNVLDSEFASISTIDQCCSVNRDMLWSILSKYRFIPWIFYSKFLLTVQRTSLSLLVAVYLIV